MFLDLSPSIGGGEHGENPHQSTLPTASFQVRTCNHAAASRRSRRRSRRQSAGGAPGPHTPSQSLSKRAFLLSPGDPPACYRYRVGDSNGTEKRARLRLGKSSSVEVLFTNLSGKSGSVNVLFTNLSQVSTAEREVSNQVGLCDLIGEGGSMLAFGFGQKANGHGGGGAIRVGDSKRAENILIDEINGLDRTNRMAN